jgi:hypothetical protein
MEWLHSVDDTSISGILCCRPRKLTKQKRLTDEVIQLQGGTHLLGRNSYKSIWIHQFLRVKVLKHLFESFPDIIPDAKTMDHLKDRLEKPTDHRLFVTDRSLAVFGESTLRGTLTRNCYRSLIDCGLPLPDWYDGELERESILGLTGNPAVSRWRKLIRRRS